MGICDSPSNSGPRQASAKTPHAISVPPGLSARAFRSGPKLRS